MTESWVENMATPPGTRRNVSTGAGAGGGGFNVAAEQHAEGGICDPTTCICRDIIDDVCSGTLNDKVCKEALRYYTQIRKRECRMHLFLSGRRMDLTGAVHRLGEMMRANRLRRNMVDSILDQLDHGSGL